MPKLNSKIFNPSYSKRTKRGNAGYDNQRENIDPRIITKSVLTKQGNIENVPTEDKHIANKLYVDSQIAGENHWDMNSGATEIHPYVQGVNISGANLTLSGATIHTTGGNVGIGTDSPDATVDIVKTVTIQPADDYLRIQNLGSSNQPYFSIDMGHAGWFDDSVLFTHNGTIIMRFDSTPIVAFTQHMYMATNKVIRANDHGGYSINMNDGSNRMRFDTAGSMVFNTDSGVTEAMRLITGGKVGIGTTNPTELLTVSGSLLFTADGEGLQCGGFHEHEGDDVQEVADGTFTLISGANYVSSSSNGITLSGGSLVVSNAGKYKVDWSLSTSSAGSNQEYDIDVHKNGADQDEAGARRKFGAAADIGNIGSTGIIDADAGDYFDLRVRGDGTTDSITVYDIDMTLLQIGG